MFEPIDAVTNSWTGRVQWSGRAVRKLFFTVTVAVFIMPIVGLDPAGAQPFFSAAVPNNAPLTFGMDANDVSLVLGTELIYIRGRPGDELYLALPNVKGSALSSRRDGLYLQFRRGRLEGWKGDWATNRPCCN